MVMKDFFKTFSPAVDENLTNAGTSEGVKKGWETRKGNRIGGSGVDSEYPKNPHDFSKSSLPIDYHKISGTAAALSSFAQNHPSELSHTQARGQHERAARSAEKSGDQQQSDYHYAMAGKHGEEALKFPYKGTSTPSSDVASIESKQLETDAAGNATHYPSGVKKWSPQPPLKNSIAQSSDRLLNSSLTGGVQITVGQLTTGLTTALGDRLTNSSIVDILCPDESGNWTAVLNDKKVSFTLKGGQPLLNWEHKEKQENPYEPWDEEPKVDGAWDEDLIGGGDEILNSWSPEARQASAESRRNNAHVKRLNEYNNQRAETPGTFEHAAREAHNVIIKSPNTPEGDRASADACEKAASAYEKNYPKSPSDIGKTYADVWREAAQEHRSNADKMEKEASNPHDNHPSGDSPAERRALAGQGIISGLD